MIVAHSVKDQRAMHAKEEMTIQKKLLELNSEAPPRKKWTSLKELAIIEQQCN